ncbi:20312_t:CDS:2, partial [Cetraspora pellucida]
ALKTELLARSKPNIFKTKVKKEEMVANYSLTKTELDLAQEISIFQGFKNLHSNSRKKLVVIIMDLKDGYYHLLVKPGGMGLFKDDICVAYPEVNILSYRRDHIIAPNLRLSSLILAEKENWNPYKDSNFIV